MILSLVEGLDPVLRSGTEEFDFMAPPTDPIQLAKDLTETMLSKAGIGFSAVQAGLPYRAFVMKTNPVIAVFNPKVIDQSEEEETLDEACLSFPGLVVPISRPLRVRVRYQQPNMQTVTKTFQGLTARCFMHELDHCDGILFYNRASRFHRDRAFQRQKVRQRRAKRADQEKRGEGRKTPEISLEWVASE